MATSRFDAVAQSLCSAIASGATIEDASRAHDVKTQTVRTWLHNGRSNPEGKYGTFAKAIDAAKCAQVVPNATAARAMSRDEWETHLAVAIRSGSVQAMKLWIDAHPSTEDPPADPFSEFDKLAEQRKQCV